LKHFEHTEPGLSGLATLRLPSHVTVESLRAHELISELPGGYEAPVNESGTNLSVGQKQLLSFARILLMDPRILILDEATASIDTKTECLLQEAVRRILVGRTSFVIAHRLSTTQT
jgi:ATP-binding cassette subfamily B multidrug efflux pump